MAYHGKKQKNKENGLSNGWEKVSCPSAINMPIFLMGENPLHIVDRTLEEESNETKTLLDFETVSDK